jgi:hypothetical protein
VTFSIQQFPDPPHTLDSGLDQLYIYFLPLATIFSFICLCLAVLKRVGEDKCSGTKVIINTLVCELIFNCIFVQGIFKNSWNEIVDVMAGMVNPCSAN